MTGFPTDEMQALARKTHARVETLREWLIEKGLLGGRPEPGSEPAMLLRERALILAILELLPRG